MSHVSAYYHIVINTYNRAANLSIDFSEDLYKYICGIAGQYHCPILAINGTRNHIHFLLDLHPSCSLSEVMREIKRGTSVWMKRDDRFRKFSRWGKEYFAFSCSARELNAVKGYISGQREHHGLVSFEDEIERVVLRNGGEWNDRMLS